MNALNISDLFASESEIRSSFEEIMSTGRALDNLIWKTGVSVVAFILRPENGNFALLSDFVQGMPNGSRVERLKAWLQVSVPVVFDDTNTATLNRSRVDTKKGTVREFRRDRSNWNVDFLLENPWYNYESQKDQQVQKEFDTDDLLKMLEKVIEGKASRSRTYTEQAQEDAETLRDSLLAIIEERMEGEETQPESLKNAA